MSRARRRQTTYLFGEGPGVVVAACVGCGFGVAAAAGFAVGVGFAALAAGAAGAVVVVAFGAVVADAAGDADCVAAAAGDAPGETGWLPPSMFGSLSILSARWLTTVTSLIALRMSACCRMLCRWSMSICLI